MNWKATVKHIIPAPILNNILLAFPFLYRTKLLNYETNLKSPCVEELLSQLKLVLNVKGNIIECGSSRCGATTIMAKYLQSENIQKTIYACDSFEGFSLTELNRERKLGLTTALSSDFTSTSYEYVKRKIRKLNVDDIIVIIKGFFQDTLPTLESDFCLAFIDCDLKDSIIYCAETIWPNLASKGRMVFDDYTFDACKGARIGIDFFIDKHKEEILEHGLINNLYYAHKK